jgi:uncharacterized repeat protein (TIGR01451 family)
MPASEWSYSLSLLLLVLPSVALAQNRVDDASQTVATSIPIVRITVENPHEINLGKAATFLVSVSNQGKSPVNDVVVTTRIPRHVELAETTPRPSEVEGGFVRFQIGTLAPGASRRMTLVTIPRTKDPIQLNATTTFNIASRSTVLVRQPMLELKAQVPAQSEIGTEVDWLIRVTNTGDGSADNIVVTPRLMEGNVQGNPLQQAVKIGGLKPGETKEVQFTVIPTRRGKLTATFQGSNADGLEATEESTFQVLQAELAVAMAGPAVQPLAREGNYEIRVTNPGDATTGAAMVFAKIPTGLEVTMAAENAYNEATRTLRWQITQIRPTDVVRLPFRAETTQAGEQTLKVFVQSDQIKDATVAHTTRVISRSNLIVTVVNDQELTAIKDPVVFKVTVINAGSRLVDDLRVRVAMPEGLNAVNSVGYNVTDGKIVFPVQKLASGEKVTLAFGVVGDRSGEHRVRVLVSGGTLSRELSFEGSAYYYSNDEAPVKTDQVTVETEEDGKANKGVDVKIADSPTKPKPPSNLPKYIN